MIPVRPFQEICLLCWFYFLEQNEQVMGFRSGRPDFNSHPVNLPGPVLQMTGPPWSSPHRLMGNSCICVPAHICVLTFHFCLFPPSIRLLFCHLNALAVPSHGPWRMSCRSPIHLAVPVPPAAPAGSVAAAVEVAAPLGPRFPCTVASLTGRPCR